MKTTLIFNGTSRDGHGALGVSYYLKTIEDGRINTYEVLCSISGLETGSPVLYAYSAEKVEWEGSNDYTLTDTEAERLAQELLG